MKDIIFSKAGNLLFQKVFSNSFYYRLQNNTRELFQNLFHDEERGKFTNTGNVLGSFVKVTITVFVIITLLKGFPRANISYNLIHFTVDVSESKFQSK